MSVATGMAMATLGTDTGGSIRIPAAACGVVGLKPTWGEIPTEGVVPLSGTLDHVGPLTADVSDGWHIYHALLGQPAIRPLTPTPLVSVRLGILRGYFCDLLDDEVRTRFEASIETLRKAGARIEDLDLAHTDHIVPIYLHIVLSDAAAYHAGTLDTMADRYTKPVRLRLEMGRYILAEDYVRALAGRELLRREVNAALSGHHALVLPTLPILAPPLGAPVVAVGSREEPVRNLMLRLTQLFNITGHPAISIPCGRASNGLPCGLQLVGAAHQTDQLLAIALAAERAGIGQQAT